jgi:hypothetical protein
VEWWSGGVVEWWSGGVVEWWSGGGVEWWSGGVVEWWSGGVVEWWSGGVVEWWSSGVVEGFNPWESSNSNVSPCKGNRCTSTKSHAYSSALSGRPIWGRRFPGLKPWAEVYSPFGAKSSPPHYLRSTTPFTPVTPSLQSLHHSITPSLRHPRSRTKNDDEGRGRLIGVTGSGSP